MAEECHHSFHSTFRSIDNGPNLKTAINIGINIGIVVDSLRLRGEVVYM